MRKGPIRVAGYYGEELHEFIEVFSATEKVETGSQLRNEG